jgi:hypothetical protein
VGDSIDSDVMTRRQWLQRCASVVIGTRAGARLMSWMGRPVIPCLRAQRSPVTSTITNRLVYMPPAIPTLGAAPFWFNDPTFSTTLVRVTDENSTSGDPNHPATGQSFNLNANTTQHGWGADSRSFYVQRTDGNFFLIKFDPLALALTWGTAILLYDDLTFDSTTPTIAYGSLTSAPNHHTVGRVDLSTSPYTYSTLFDAATVAGTSFPAGNTYLNTIMCAAGKLVVLCGGVSQDQHYLVIWYPLGNPMAARVLNTQAHKGLGFGVHSVGLDQTGRYVVITPSTASGAPYALYVWDTTTDTVTPVENHAGGHNSTGINGELINQTSITIYDAFQYVIRQLSAVNGTLREVVEPVLTPQEIYAADHSCSNDAVAGEPLVFTSSTYRYNSADGSPYTYTSSPLNTVPWRPCDGEIVRVNTSGVSGASTPIRRICHNRALADAQTQGGNGFPNQPLLNVSPNGEWVLFQSNWEATLGTDSETGLWRTDVFLAYLGANVPQRPLRLPALRTP